MRNDAIIGVSCFIIGGYNYWNFYTQNKLYKFNTYCYISVLFVGIIFLTKFCFQFTKTKKIQKSRSITPKSQANLPENFSNSLNSEIKLDCLSPDSKHYQKIERKIKVLLDSSKQLQVHKLKNVYKIRNNITKEIFKLQQKLNSSICFIEGKEGISNTNYFFHGTTKLCSDFSKICVDPYCFMCSILKSGFKLNFSGKGVSTDLRYGKGLYFSPDLGKSLNYVNNGKFLLYCKVILGNVYFAKDNDSFLDEFNENKYQSIIGDPKNNGMLSSMEICIKKGENAYPKYILEFEEK